MTTLAAMFGLEKSRDQQIQELRVESEKWENGSKNANNYSELVKLEELFNKVHFNQNEAGIKIAIKQRLEKARALYAPQYFTVNTNDFRNQSLPTLKGLLQQLVAFLTEHNTSLDQTTRTDLAHRRTRLEQHIQHFEHPGLGVQVAVATPGSSSAGYSSPSFHPGLGVSVQSAQSAPYRGAYMQPTSFHGGLGVPVQPAAPASQPATTFNSIFGVNAVQATAPIGGNKIVFEHTDRRLTGRPSEIFKYEVDQRGNKALLSKGTEGSKEYQSLKAEYNQNQ